MVYTICHARSIKGESQTAVCSRFYGIPFTIYILLLNALTSFLIPLILYERAVLYSEEHLKAFILYLSSVFLVAHFNSAEMIAKQILSYTSVVGAGELCERDGQ